MPTHSEVQVAFRAGRYREAFDLIRRGAKQDRVLALQISQLVGGLADAAEEAHRLIKLGRLTKHEQARCFAMIAINHRRLS